MTPDEKELREIQFAECHCKECAMEHRRLDAEIAEIVFGHKWGHWGALNKKGLPMLVNEPIYLVDLSDRKHKPHLIPDSEIHTYKRFTFHGIPRYATDPAAAMGVLKKCIKDLDKCTGRTDFQVVVLFEEASNEWVVTTDSLHDADTDIHMDNCSSAPTLELAIARFARQLFGKGEKCSAS